jgi:predicted secreted protein
MGEIEAMLLINLLFIAQAPGATPPAPTPAQAPAPPAVEHKVICHSEIVGQSRIAQRICHTKAEWDEIGREAEENFKYNVNRHTQGNNPE